MDDKEGAKIPLRLHVLKEKNQVVFAEANSDFVDTLFSYLTLPMGKIVRILKTKCDLQAGDIGCFGNLYQSVENLDASHLLSEECKQMLLNPVNVAGVLCRRLKLNIDDTSPANYRVCHYLHCAKPELSLNSIAAAKCNCGREMREPMKQPDHSTGGAFVSETGAFIVTDDLHVIPNLPTTVFELFQKLGISDLDAVDEINLNVGYKEMLTILHCSLHSNSPLTSTFVSKGSKGSNSGCLLNYEMGNSSGNGMGKMEEAAEMAMTIKLVIQKSNNKMLFAHAEENFVNFLFSLLTIPLGGLARLSGNISFGSVGNLYNSLSTLDPEKHLKSPQLKNMLQNPQLAALHISQNQLFSFLETETEYYRQTKRVFLPSGGHIQNFYVVQNQVRGFLPNESCKKLLLKDPKFKGQYARPSMFIVTPDMHVASLTKFSVVSHFRRLGIPLSDVEEQVINIGMAEVQKILKASFESNLVLTDEDIKIMTKRIKREQT
nr:PREDICTED: uncharacterized protein LOC108217110 [Daucus carota subsp. sativus]